MDFPSSSRGHRELNRLFRSESLRPESRFGLLDSRMLRFSCPGRNESATDCSSQTEIASDNPCSQHLSGNSLN